MDWCRCISTARCPIVLSRALRVSWEGTQRYRLDKESICRFNKVLYWLREAYQQPLRDVPRPVSADPQLVSQLKLQYPWGVSAGVSPSWEAGGQVRLLAMRVKGNCWERTAVRITASDLNHSTEPLRAELWNYDKREGQFLPVLSRDTRDAQVHEAVSWD